MPFVKRSVEPVYIRRGALEKAGISLGGEHEAVVNGCLAQAVRQIADLSLLADGLFQELLNECSELLSRSDRLGGRIRLLQRGADCLDFLAPESSYINHTWADVEAITAVGYRQEYALFTPASRSACLHRVYHSAAESAGAPSASTATVNSQQDEQDGWELLQPGSQTVPTCRLSMEPVFARSGPIFVDHERRKTTVRRQPRVRPMLLLPPVRNRCPISEEPAVLANEQQLKRCMLPTPEQRLALAIGSLPPPVMVKINTSPTVFQMLANGRSMLRRHRASARVLLTKDGWHYQTLPARRQTIAGSLLGHARQSQSLLLDNADSLRLARPALTVDLSPSSRVLAKDPDAYVYDSDGVSSVEHDWSQSLSGAIASGRTSRPSHQRRSDLIGRLRRSLSLPRGFERGSRRSPCHHDGTMTASGLGGRSWRTQQPAASALFDDRSELIYVNFYGEPNADATREPAAAYRSADARPSMKHSQSEHARLSSRGGPHDSGSSAAAFDDATCRGRESPGLSDGQRARSHGHIDQFLVSSNTGGRELSAGMSRDRDQRLRPKSLSSDRLHGLHVGSGGGGKQSGGSRLSHALSGFFRRKQSTPTAAATCAVGGKQVRSSSLASSSVFGATTSTFDEGIGGSKTKSKSRSRLSQLFLGLNGGGGGVTLRKRDSKATSSSSGRWSGSERYSMGSDTGGCQATAVTALSQSRQSRLSADRDSAVSDGSFQHGELLSFDPAILSASATGEVPALCTFSSVPMNRCSYIDQQPGSGGPFQAAACRPPAQLFSTAAAPAESLGIPQVSLDSQGLTFGGSRLAVTSDGSGAISPLDGGREQKEQEKKASTFGKVAASSRPPLSASCHDADGLPCQEQTCHAGSSLITAVPLLASLANCPSDRLTSTGGCGSLPRAGRSSMPAWPMRCPDAFPDDATICRRLTAGASSLPCTYNSLPRNFGNRLSHCRTAPAGIAQNASLETASHCNLTPRLLETAPRVLSDASVAAIASLMPRSLTEAAEKHAEVEAAGPDSSELSSEQPELVLPLPEAPPPVMSSLAIPFGQSRCHDLRRSVYRRSLSPGVLEQHTATASVVQSSSSALVSSLIQEARSMSAPTSGASPSPARLPTGDGESGAAGAEAPCSEAATGGCFVRRASYRVALAKACHPCSSTCAADDSSPVAGAASCCLLCSAGTAEMPGATTTALATHGEADVEDGNSGPLDDEEDDGGGRGAFIRSYSYRVANRSSLGGRKRGGAAAALSSLSTRRSQLLLVETEHGGSPTLSQPARPGGLVRHHGPLDEAHDDQGDDGSSSRVPRHGFASSSSTAAQLDWSMLPAGGGDGARLEIAYSVRFSGRFGPSFCSAAAAGISSSLSRLNLPTGQFPVPASGSGGAVTSTADGQELVAARQRERPKSTFFPKGDLSSAELAHGLLALQQRCHEGSGGAFTSLEMLRQDERMLLSLMDAVVQPLACAAASAGDCAD